MSKDDFLINIIFLNLRHNQCSSQLLILLVSQECFDDLYTLPAMGGSLIPGFLVDTGQYLSRVSSVQGRVQIAVSQTFSASISHCWISCVLRILLQCVSISATGDNYFHWYLSYEQLLQIPLVLPLLGQARVLTPGSNCNLKFNSKLNTLLYISSNDPGQLLQSVVTSQHCTVPQHLSALLCHLCIHHPDSQLLWSVVTQGRHLVLASSTLSSLQTPA